MGATLPDSWGPAARDPVSRAGLSRAIAAERLRGAYGDMTPLASALLEASRREPSPATALALAGLAAEAAPGDPRPHLRLAELLLLELRSPGRAFKAFLSFAAAAISDPWAQALALAGLAGVAWLGAATAVLALLVLAAAACGPPLYHDYADAFPRRLRAHLPWASGLLVLAALASAGVGPLALVGIFSLGFIAYLPERSRWALAGCLLVATLVSPLGTAMSGLGTREGQRAWALYRVEKGGSAEELEAELSRLFGPQEREGLVARAYVARRAGKLSTATQLLEAAAGRGDDDGFALLELANVLFQRGFLDEAASRYGEAARLRPADALPWINLHVLRLKRLELAEADRALATAESLSPSAVATFLRLPGGSEGLMPLSVPFPSAWTRRELVACLGAGAPWADALAQALFVPVGAAKPVYLSLLVLLVGVSAGRGKRARRSHRCPSCGGVVCPRCSRRVRGSRLCSGCWALLSQKGTDAAERERQTRVAERWEERSLVWRRTASVVLPGWPSFFLDGSLRGLALGLLWSVALGGLALHAIDRAPALPWSLAGPPVGSLALLGMVYALAARTALRRTLRERRL